MSASWSAPHGRAPTEELILLPVRTWARAATAALASSLVFFKKSFALAVHRWVPEVFKRLGMDYHLVERALAKVVQG